MEHGYVVDGGGSRRLAPGDDEQYDLILLDVMLPGIDGWSVLQGLRRQRQTPVLFLSARDQVDDRVKGLKLGADDYLVKPFAFSELLARVQSVLRRGQVPRDQTLRVADLEIDPLRRRVTRSGNRLELTAKEYALLEYFARHAGEMCSPADRRASGHEFRQRHQRRRCRGADCAPRSTTRMQKADPHGARVGYLDARGECAAPGQRCAPGGSGSMTADQPVDHAVSILIIAVSRRRHRPVHPCGCARRTS
jgi:CheY-like chemotaxis protein